MDLKDILNERDKLGHDMRELHELATKEERAFTSDENERWAKMTARVNELKGLEERVSAIDSAFQGVDRPVNTLPGDTRGTTDDREHRDEPTYVDAFRAYIAHGESELSPEQRSLLREHRAQSVGTATAGGHTVPEEISQTIIKTLVDFGGIMAIANTFQTAGGGNLEFITNDDTANSGSLLAENTQVSEQDLTYGQKIIGAYKFTSDLVRISSELLQDSQFDMDSEIGQALGVRLGRGMAPYLATGTASSQPEGVTVGGGDFGGTSPAASTIAFTDFVELEHSVDVAYRNGGNCRFLFNDATLKYIQKLADSEGRPLWLPRVADGVPATIYGYPYTVDAGMPSLGSSTKPVMFGDFRAGYRVRLVSGISVRRLNERYADYDQVGILGFARMDAKVVDSAAIKWLDNAA